LPCRNAGSKASLGDPVGSIVAAHTGDMGNTIRPKISIQPTGIRALRGSRPLKSNIRPAGVGSYL
jgi:hypothetical protein